MSKRIGILTGGGDCPGLNGVIRAVVLHARNTYGWETVGIRNGFEGLYEQQYVDLDPAKVQTILARGGTMLGSSNRANPFAYPLRLHRIVGVPKTIDNDLEATEYTIGFQTAVEVVVEALERLATTAESHERIIICEVMGRYAGWIALTAGLAGGAHAVLIPEIDYDVDKVISCFNRRSARGVSYSIVVCAEGAKPKGGDFSVAVKGDVTKQDKLGGAGQRLADLITAKTDYEVRTTVLGHIQRGGAPCAFDRELATRFGVKAVDLIGAGQFGHVAALENHKLVAKPIAKAVKKLKLVDPAGELAKAARAVGIELGE
jgi:6-phosphofructokinase 1